MKISIASRHPVLDARVTPRRGSPLALREPHDTRPAPLAPLAHLDHGDHRVRGDNGPAMSQVVALTLTTLVNRAGGGEDVSSKIASCWVVGGGIRKDFNAAHPVVRRGLAARVWAVVMAATIALDRARLEALAAPEVTISRISWYLRSDRERRMADLEDRFGPQLGEGDATLAMDDSELWALSLERLSEGDEISEEFANVASLVAHSHGIQVVDEARLMAYEAGGGEDEYDPWAGAKGSATRSHHMATESALIADGCKLVNRDGRPALVAKGISQADANRDEVGPYTWLRSTEWGDEEMGYQGMGDSTDDLDPRPLVDEGNVHTAQNSIEQGQVKGAMADARVERGARFHKEFEAAMDCQDNHDSLVKAYQAAWVRYRAAQLSIGLALDKLEDAPTRLRRAYNAARDQAERGRIIRENRKVRLSREDHGLWSHVHLSRSQWDVVEAVYAARSGLDGRLADGRLEIARLRGSTKAVQEAAGLPARPLRRKAAPVTTDRVGMVVNHRTFGQGTVVSERGDGAMIRVTFATGTKVVSTDLAFWV